jgi:P-type E1-E2 ATPase
VNLPVAVMSIAVAVPLAVDVVKGLVAKRLGADLFGLIAIMTAAIMDEWLVAGVIALMVSGGRALEDAASARASAVLAALARRSPSLAHVQLPTGDLSDVDVAGVKIGDCVVVLPNEICPVDGTVVEGSGSMDESYLTGEPYVIPKTPGSPVLSGAINGTEGLVIRADKTSQDSRYAQIVEVLTKAEAEQPPMRRLADRRGAIHTGIALVLALVGWAISGDPSRFLAVIVIATPCPMMMIGVPIAIIGAIALSARYGIIIKDPSMLERISTARTMIFDKTGTLTYGRPALSTIVLGAGMTEPELLQIAASLSAGSRSCGRRPSSRRRCSSVTAS